MIKKNLTKLIIGSVLILLPVLAGVLLWDRLPETMVTHWGTDNNPDGWSPRWVVVFGLPLVLLAVHWGCMVLTALDPMTLCYDGAEMELAAGDTAFLPAASPALRLKGEGRALFSAEKM
jgi:hypothetical protein